MLGMRFRGLEPLLLLLELHLGFGSWRGHHPLVTKAW
jgi:hypothetical protein